ncbi:hypothetical protein DERP_000558, partial [Dermatophagoides pteronyssinus]
MKKPIPENQMMIMAVVVLVVMIKIPQHLLTS